MHMRRQVDRGNILWVCPAVVSLQGPAQGSFGTVKQCPDLTAIFLFPTQVNLSIAGTPVRVTAFATVPLRLCCFLRSGCVGSSALLILQFCVETTL